MIDTTTPSTSGANSMVTNEMVGEMIRGTRPAFIFTFGGMIQLWQQGHGMGIIIATSRTAADIVAADLTNKKGAKVSVAEVGTVNGETLTEHLAVAVLDHGATGVFVTETGKEFQHLEAPPVPDGD